MKFAFPFKTALLLGALCYVIIEPDGKGGTRVAYATEGKDLTRYRTEFYPFSAFPMYSTFADEVFYVYLTDATGNPVKLSAIPHATASHLTKDYNRYRDELARKAKYSGPDTRVPIELKQAAALKVAENLMQHRCRAWFAERPDQTFGIVEGILYQKDGKPHSREQSLLRISYQSLTKP
jgi:hypothetical protein